MVGHTEVLKQVDSVNNKKAQTVNLSNLLHRPKAKNQSKHVAHIKQDHELNISLDETTLKHAAKDALESQTPVFGEFDIQNTNRVAGTMLGSEITQKYGAEGLPE